ncbi:transcriptional repressor TraM [Rhizobium pusense]|uniref:transcriptional repressor TraM n=1 Tax=Agrobacterium pusense TaxID=648995 RepID=UPI001FCD8E1B|nr:transcriptional repressor TraM [Agrobacterium pusense]MCJ2877644.1 transcriptional repressor TraM [Agrobacterium pusense]
MELEDVTVTKSVELRPLIGLTRGLPPADLETITIEAIRTHRQLVEKADELFQALPETYKTGKEAGGAQHVRYIEASIEMHAQMSAVNTLISILGFIPKIVVN